MINATPAGPFEMGSTTDDDSSPSYDFGAALESYLGGLDGLLDDPDRLEARAAWLRAGIAAGAAAEARWGIRGAGFMEHGAPI